MKSSRLGYYLLALCAIALATFIAEFFRVIFPTRDLIMFYLLAVVVTALYCGRGPAIMSSIVGVVVFDYYFVPPRFGFIAIHKEDWIALLSFLAVSILIGTLTAQERESRRQIRDMQVLREKEKFQSILLHSVSHDLRTPLASITATLSNLLYNEHLDDETRNELVETAYGESARMNQVVGNLLDMTRVEAGALNVLLKPCDIRDLVGASVGQFSKESTAKRSIAVRVEGLPEVPLDFTLMMKVLVNLLDNAFKYSPQDSPVEIEARITNEGLILEVLDYGPGIAEEDRDHVFEKFYRRENPDKISGTGLGLAICKGIVEAHKGRIWAENRPKGLKVSIQLPLRKEITD